MVIAAVTTFSGLSGTGTVTGHCFLDEFPGYSGSRFVFEFTQTGEDADDGFLEGLSLVIVLIFGQKFVDPLSLLLFVFFCSLLLYLFELLEEDEVPFFLGFEVLLESVRYLA